MNELQIAKEVFLSILKWVLVFILLNNLIWAVLFFALVNGSEVSNTQEIVGENNTQEMSNGQIKTNITPKGVACFASKNKYETIIWNKGEHWKA